MSIRNRFTRTAAALAVGIGGLCSQSTVQADGFRLNRLIPPALASDGLSLPKPQTLKKRQWSTGILLNYANDPLKLEIEQGARGTLPIVSHQLDALLAGSYGLADNLSIFATLNVVAAMNGNSVPTASGTDSQDLADGPGLGDFRLGLRYGVLENVSPAKFSLSLEAAATVPLADLVDADQNLRGEAGFGGEALVIAGADLGVLSISANIGGRFRKKATLFGSDIGSEVFAGVGLLAPVHAMADVLLEWRTSTLASDAFGKASTPMELLVGARVKPMEGWAVKVGGGPGITPGLGSPDFRVVASIWYASPVQTDTDGDGIDDNVDRCIAEAEDKDGFEDEDGCVDPDNDGDGVLDTQDKCPGEAEDKDGFEDEDGCPEDGNGVAVDGDSDGIPDAQDKCPAEAEDKDGFEDEDGCVDPDNDGDGVLDTQDKCPGEAEDKDGFEDEDGCIDPDNDGDGILDADDKCPAVPGDAEHQGCSAKVKLDEGQIKILERVEFAVGKDVIATQSNDVLKAVQSILAVNKNIKRIAVIGHTDNQGASATNTELSTRRAKAVTTWLTTAGIDASQIEAWGCGEDKALTDNKTPEDRRKNRRVEFHLLDPAPKQSADLAGCTKAE